MSRRKNFRSSWILSSEDRIYCGVPLGGIGAGKLELTPEGLLNAFTFQNNWSEPLSGGPEYPGLLGFHFAVKMGQKVAFLQTRPVLNYPHFKRLRYEGVFPRATLLFEEPAWGLEGSLEASSPWIPGDVKNSSLPVCLFRLTLKNRRSVPAEAGFLFIGRNLCGEWCVGRQNKITDRKGLLDLEFSSVDKSPVDGRLGTLSFSFLKQGWRWSSMESWNAVTRNFSFDTKNVSLSAWDSFSREGKLPETRSGTVVRSENYELCGAVSAAHEIGPGQKISLDFSAGWYFPNHRFGHRYQKWFRSASQVSHYAIKHRRRFRAKRGEIETAVLSFPFPAWFNHALLANLAPFFSSSWYTRDGRFSFYEAPKACPLMGTIDVGFYGSIPLSYFFPELEISLLTQFARAQRSDGYIPHDLGRNRLDLPSNGTTFHLWKDLNPKFVLMAYRDWCWSRDDAFVRKIYPAVKKAVHWSFQNDRDANGLPDHGGADQTFDLWSFYGAHSYTASLFLAALLAAQKMAERLGDRSTELRYRAAFEKGRASFEKEIWNGNYFGSRASCTLAQLNGQWYADLLGLGSIADNAKIRKALTFILSRNSRPSAYGMVNSVSADGRLDTSNDHSKNIWAGMNYAFVSLCLMRGFALAPLLKEVHKIWDNVTRVQKSPWNQPDTIDSKTGRYVFGDFYYRNMAIWSIPIAYSMRDLKTARLLRAIRAASKSK